MAIKIIHTLLLPGDNIFHLVISNLQASAVTWTGGYQDIDIYSGHQGDMTHW